jgi:signal transduction histidine kinase
VPRAPERRGSPRLTRPRLGLLSAAVLTAPTVLVLARLAGLVRGLDAARSAERRARREAEQAQRLLAARNEQLEELDRLKDEFVSLVSHDLRTPLTSISGYVELLLENEGIDDESRGFLSVIDRNAGRLLHLVDDLLFVARVQAGSLAVEHAEVDLTALAQQCVQSLRPRADAAGVALELELDGAVGVCGESGRLAQLLDNLVSNAIKFTPSGGVVEVNVRRAAAAAIVEVCDTGIGMSAEEREQLFERFFRASGAVERQIQGTGLGLYIAKAIVDAHRGRIAVEERPGGGTIFRVELEAA